MYNESAENILADALTELDNLGTVHKFPFDDAVKDKSGEKVKFLEINLDKAGIFPMLVMHGDVVKQTKDGIEEDTDKLFKLLNFISNIELNDSNMNKIGWALMDAREIAKSFFSLKLVIRSLKAATENTKNSTIQAQDKV